MFWVDLAIWLTQAYTSIGLCSPNGFSINGMKIKSEVVFCFHPWDLWDLFWAGWDYTPLSSEN